MKALSIFAAVGGILSFIAGQWTLAVGLACASHYFWDAAKDAGIPEALEVED
jgi:hypothetical protein